ncbi:CubicO group peptidase, beta-lactamase class C family [Rhodospirillales bacterium URHD0017]|nr:CubicO group peptidase, beta-lactamase class C family [Rhodospirillales bacterium URHD0017]
MASDPFSTIQSDINALVEQHNQSNGAQLGVVVCAVAGGESQVICSEGVDIQTRGGNNQSVSSTTPFEIGSVSELFTAGIFNKLQEGLFDTTLKDLFTGVTLSSFVGKITVGDLLGYSSGFPQDNGDPRCPCAKLDGAGSTVDKVFDFLGNYAGDYTPGTKYSYSNLGMSVASMAALTVGTGTPDQEFSDLLNDALIKYCQLFTVDLGNTPTTVLYNHAVPDDLPRGYNKNYEIDDRDPCPIPEYGSGGIVSTGDDMMAFLHYCMSSQYPATLQKPAWSSGLTGICKPYPTVNPGYGWFIDKTTSIVMKDGAVPGFTSWIGLQPYESTTNACGLVIMVNGPDATSLGKGYLGNLMGLSKGALLGLPDQSY